MSDWIDIHYKPHRFQKKFHMSKARIRLLLAGIRGGKTYAGANEAIKMVVKGWKTFKTPNVGCCLAPTYPNLRDFVLPTFFKFCDPRLIKKNGWNKSEYRLELITGCKILFRSGEHPERLRGPEFHWFWMDEGRGFKPEVFDIMMGRISQTEGCGFITSSAKLGWMDHRIIKPFSAGDKDYNVVTFTSYDNPYFPKKAIDKLKKLYTPEFFQQEVMAKSMAFKGLIYKVFVRSKHIRDIDLKTIKYYVAGVDFGFENPSAIVVVGYDSDDKAHIVDEYFESGKTTSQLIEVAKDLNEKYKIDAFFCDPNRLDAVQQFTDEGLNGVKGNNKVAPGINKVIEVILRGFKISSKCINTIREFETYSYRPNTDKPIKTDDHAVDALRYALMGEEKSVSIEVFGGEDTYKTY